MSDIVYGDRIQVGDIEGSGIAIGNGAQVIIQQAQSSVDIARQQAERDRQVLAQNVQRYVEALVAKAKGTDGERLFEPESRQPFKSLYAYTLADTGSFYGREDAVNDLLKAIERNTLTVLHGDSGVGKTSILQAGLSPHLLASSHLPIVTTMRRRAVTEEIKRVVLPDLELVPVVSAMSLRGFLREVQEIVGPNTVVALILDQFETIFAPVFSEQARHNDFEEIRECIQDPLLNTRIIISITDEMFGKLSSFESDVVKPYENHYRLVAPGLQESRDIIVLTAARAGISYEDGLVDKILADFGTTEIAPAQLQIVLSTLVDQLAANEAQIAFEHYTRVGGVNGVLTNYLSAIKAQLTSPDRQIAQAILEGLVDPGHQRDAKTHSQLREEVEGLGLDASRLDEVLGFLLRKRIISPIRMGELADAYAFEIVHQYIAEQVELSPEAQAKKVARDLLDRKVIDYRQFGTLLEPDQLQILTPQLGFLKLSDEEQELVSRSKADIAKRRVRRIALIAAACLVPVLLVLVWLQGELRVAEERISSGNAAVAVQNTADSKVAAATQELGDLILAQGTVEAELLSAEATRASAERDASHSSTVATRLARAESFGIGSDPQDALVLGSTVWIAHGRPSLVRVMDRGDGSSMADIPMPEQPGGLASANGQIWIAANNDVVVVDPASLSVADSMPIPGRAGDVVYDGKHVWISNEDGVTSVDPESKAILQKITLDGGAHKLEFDGELLWVSSYAGTALSVLSPESGKVVSQLASPDPIFALMFDGETIWVTSDRSGVLRGYDPRTLEIAHEYTIGRSLSGLAHDIIGLWVADYADNALLNLDGSTGETLGRYRVGRGPAVLTFDGQRIWSLSGVDRTATVIPLQFPVPLSPAQLAYDDGIVWFIDQSSPRLMGVDENTGAVVADYELSAVPTSLAAQDHQIWVTLQGSPQIAAINPADGRESLGAQADGEIASFQVIDGLVWVAPDRTQQVSAINLQSGEVVTTYDVPGNPVLLAKLGTSLWAATQDTQRLIEVDAEQGIVASYPLSGLPLSMIGDEDGQLIWVGIAGTNLVQALDPDTGGAVTSLSLSHEPDALLVASKELWAAGADTVSRVSTQPDLEPLSYRVGRGALGMAFGKDRVWVAGFTDKTLEYIAVHD